MAERIASRVGGMHPPTTTEVAGRNRTLDTARRNGKPQRQLSRKQRLAAGNPFSLLTAHANGRPLFTRGRVQGELIFADDKHRELFVGMLGPEATFFSFSRIVMRFRVIHPPFF